MNFSIKNIIVNYYLLQTDFLSSTIKGALIKQLFQLVMKFDERKYSLKTVEGSISTRSVHPENPIAMLILAHGAGAGIEHQFMVDIQQEMAKVGLASFAFNFLSREQGKGVPFRMTRPIKTYVEVWDYAAETYNLPQFAAGKSYGGRVGSMAVDQLSNCKGLIFLGYPFHPPGKLEKLRTEHLYNINLPMLFLQGTRDALSTADIANKFIDEHKPAKIVWLEDGEHSWKPRKKTGLTQKDLMINSCKEMRGFCLSILT